MRSVDQIVRDTLGNLHVQIIQLTEMNEKLVAELAKLKEAPPAAPAPDPAL